MDKSKAIYYILKVKYHSNAPIYYHTSWDDDVGSSDRGLFKRALNLSTKLPSKNFSPLTKFKNPQFGNHFACSTHGLSTTSQFWRPPSQ